MVVDQANDVEAIGHDFGVGKVLANDRAVNARHVHADNLDAVFAGQLLQIMLQSRFTASEDDVEDGVRPQIAERGRVAVLPGKEMLIDAQDPRASGAAPLGEFALKIIVKPSFDGGAADA